MSPVPDVLEVAGEAPGDDEDGVEAHVVAGADVAGGERFGGGGDPAEAIIVEREGCVAGGGAGFYFDEH